MKKRIYIILLLIITLFVTYLFLRKTNDVTIEIKNKTNNDIYNISINLFPSEDKYTFDKIIKGSQMKLSFDLPEAYEGQIRMELKDQNNNIYNLTLVTYAANFNYKSYVEIEDIDGAKKLNIKVKEKESIFF